MSAQDTTESARLVCVSEDGRGLAVIVVFYEKLRCRIEHTVKKLPRTISLSDDIVALIAPLPSAA